MHSPGRDPEWGDPINAYTKWVVAALVTLCVLFVGIPMATAHVSTLSTPGVVGWTHSDHANDPIGQIACVQNAYVVKCIGHNNDHYEATGVFPQVAAKPDPAGTRDFGFIQEEPLGWWWIKGRVGNDTAQGVCVFDLRPYRLPQLPGHPGNGPVSPEPRYFQVACLGPNDKTHKNVNDASVDGTVLRPTPPDFVRAEAAPAPAVPLAAAALAPSPSLRGLAPRGFARRTVNAYNAYLSVTRRIMIASVTVKTGAKPRAIEVCLGTSGNGKLACRSAFTRSWNVGLSYPCGPKLPFRLWLLRVNGFPVASTYARC